MMTKTVEVVVLASVVDAIADSSVSHIRFPRSTSDSIEYCITMATDVTTEQALISVFIEKKYDILRWFKQ